MAIVTAEGIVLRTWALGDTSRIAVVYTRDHGTVKLVAKGARRPKSPFRGKLDLVCLAVSLVFFFWMFRLVRKKGLLARVGE